MAHESPSSEWNWKKNPGISAGADVERAVFGAPRLERGQYVAYREALEYVKNNQPSLQERPKIATMLRRKVADLCSDESLPVKFYTAVGTPLDIYHGVDAFFEQGSKIVTVDISMREKETTKADVLLVASMDEEGRVLIAANEMQQVAEKIATLLSSVPARKVA